MGEVWKDEELRTFLYHFRCVARHGLQFGESYRIFFGRVYSTFTVPIYSISSTGYSRYNFSEWLFSQFVLLLLMIIGASAGSTGGGLKVLIV